jgi:hypothetical protein
MAKFVLFLECWKITEQVVIERRTMMSRQTEGRRRKTGVSFEVISVHGTSKRQKAKVTTVFPLRGKRHQNSSPDLLLKALIALNREKLCNDVKLVLFPAGFIRLDWIKDLHLERPKQPDQYDVKTVFPVLQKYLNAKVRPLFNGESIGEIPNRMLLGMDVKYSGTATQLPGEAQLGILLDKNLRITGATAKFYNPPAEERTQWNLISTCDYSTHFMNIPYLGEALVLYCFDLAALTGRKKYALKDKKTMRKINAADRTFKKRHPKLGLHLGHILEKQNTWKGKFTEVFVNKYGISNYISSSDLKLGEEKRFDTYRVYGGDIGVRAVIIKPGPRKVGRP